MTLSHHATNDLNELPLVLFKRICSIAINDLDFASEEFADNSLKVSVNATKLARLNFLAIKQKMNSFNELFISVSCIN